MAHGIRSIRGAYCLAIAFAVAAWSSAVWSAEPEAKPVWLKGNIHCHSFWSDGDEFPEMAADWYKQHGYQFLALSDHDRLMRGERWMKLKEEKRSIPEAVVEKYRARFGDDWIDVRGEGDARQVRLKTYDEIRGKLEEPGKFVLIQGEEITGGSGKWAAHLSAINLVEPIASENSRSVRETLRSAAIAVENQSKQAGRPILAVINHPNWRWLDISARDAAWCAEAGFFEVCNNSSGVNNLPSGDLPTSEKIWDAANALRIAKDNLPVLFGVASDDTHNYQHFGPGSANPGRGWIMVRAKEPTANAIVTAMLAGDFYGSTGVTLRDVSFDAQSGRLHVAVEPVEGVHTTITFLGTLADCDLTGRVAPLADKHGRGSAMQETFSPEVGKVLLSVEGAEGSYTLSGKELYVRAVVRSDRKVQNRAEGAAEYEEAWCQPVRLGRKVL